MANNPFDLNSNSFTQPQQNQGLINNAGTFTQEQGGTSFSAIQPGTNSTVSGQLNGLLSTDSPYLKAARERSKRQANSRGLINSSIAAGAGETAAIEAAMPIAQQDASTFFAAQQGNQNAANSFMNQKNTFDFQGTQAGLDRAQQTALQSNQFGFQGAQAALDREQQTNLQNNQYRFQGEQAGLDRTQQSTLLDRELAATKDRQQLDIASRERLAAEDNKLRMDLLNTQIASQKDLASLELELNKQLQAFTAELGDEQRLLELTRGRNVNLQLSQINMSQQMLQQIGSIMANIDIPGDAKQGLIDSLKSQYQTTFDLIGSLEDVPVLTEGQGGF